MAPLFREEVKWSHLCPIIKTWVERYGDRIGNFGDIDTDHLCRMPEAELRELVRRLFRDCRGHGGFAVGSGNSILDYVVPPYILPWWTRCGSREKSFTRKKFYDRHGLLCRGAAATVN